MQGHDDWVWSVAFAPNGKLLASTSGDATVKIWSIQENGSYSIFQTLTLHTKSVRTVAFSSDGRKIATGGVDRILWLWDTKTWEPIANYEHSDWIRSLAFNNQGYLASTSQDGVIKLWDTNSNALIPKEIYPELHLPKLYEGMNLQGAKGLTQIQAKNLTALGAISI
ncbi:MAG: hypothetical protein HC908_12160 [Calothrix sp. SM1_7_51]|nr:hypothetical protein [Calothrix sp. SM1_7_51]